MLVRGSRSDHQIYDVHTYSPIPDPKGEEHMERALHHVHPGFRQEETCHMDGWPQRRADRNRCTIHIVCSFGTVYLQLYVQTWPMRSQIGTRHLDIRKMKRKRFKTFSIPPNLLLELANLLMSGGRIIQKTNITHISRTDLIAGPRVSVGDWTCVSCQYLLGGLS
jgi:hypothetical protein